MNVREIERESALRRALDVVDTFFDGVFAPLDAWLPELTGQLREQREKGPVTGAQLAELVEPGAHRILDSASRPLYGAGYCASEEVVSEGNPLAWWQGPDRSLLATSTFGPGQAAIDLVRLEWYRVPRETGERHIAGPFVDYLCSNEITLTSAVPVVLDGRFSGVICADVLVADLEGELLPHFAEIPDATLANANGRIVLSAAPAYETGDRLDPDPGHTFVVRSARHPFTLLSA